jgi:hypothetical protein
MVEWRRLYSVDVDTEVGLLRAEEGREDGEEGGKEEGKAFIEAQLTGPSTIDENDDRWGVLFTSEETEESNGDNDSDASSLSYYRTMSYACNKI